MQINFILKDVTVNHAVSQKLDHIGSVWVEARMALQRLACSVHHTLITLVMIQ